MKKRMVMAATATLVVGLGASVTAASAADYIYWSAFGQSSSIGRAAIDGSAVNESFISGLSGAASPMLTASNIFWLDGFGSISLAKAGLDGSAVNTSLASLGTSFNMDQATVQGSYVYFPAPFGGRIGRVGTDGNGVDASFSQPVFQGSPVLEAVTSDADALYTKSPNADEIAKVGLDGTVLNAAWATGVTPQIVRMATGDGYVYWSSSTGIGRIKADGTGQNNAFISGLSNAGHGIAVGGGYIYWGWGAFGSPYGIGRVKTDGTDMNVNFITGLTQEPSGLAVTGGSAPTPAPAPTSDPAPTATVLKAPTQSSTADSNGNVAVSLSLQLDEVGKYTFIFEKVTSNEMSREQASGSSRISMQKGTKIGKRKLTKTVTAADVTTTSAGAKVVMRALLKKAQAKKWNLRVIHAAADGTLTQSVIKK